MLVVADTGPIISLSLLNQLDILDTLFEQVVIPEAVWQELDRLIPIFSIPQARKYQNRVITVKQALPYKTELDIGETEAIQLFQEIKADLLLLEDKDARLFAESTGITCIGTPGVLVLAKRKGHISALRPLFFELLAKERYFSVSLLNKILSDNNETYLHLQRETNN
jgi:predicted nucleic acid-binding protein